MKVKSNCLKKGTKVELIEKISDVFPGGKKGESLGEGIRLNETTVEFEDGNVISVETSKLKIISN